MQTHLSIEYLASGEGKRANEILRSCVHCGFCNATCPTYQLLGDELDGPRGRIYLIKEMLETQEADDITRVHLDRCLTCRACETTCPSGVDYGDLLEIGRNFLEAESETRRSWRERITRSWVLRTLPYPNRLRRWAILGRLFRWLLPSPLRNLVPKTQSGKARFAKCAQPETDVQHPGTKKVLVLRGCVERVVTPEAQRRLSRILAANEIEMLWSPRESCCGAMALHLGEKDKANASIQRNIDAIWNVIEASDGDIEAIISTASGCGVTVKDYGKLMAGDSNYAKKARRISGLTQDVAEYLSKKNFSLTKSATATEYARVAWQSPCTLQHGQRVKGLVEPLLQQAGYHLVVDAQATRCCGAAGTYTLFQPEMSEALRQSKLEALTDSPGNEIPDVIASANVGCIAHLRSESPVPVLHWLELLGSRETAEFEEN